MSFAPQPINYRLKASPTDYSKISITHLPLDIGSSERIEVAVTSVNFQNVIRTLRKDDWITINHITYKSNHERLAMNPLQWGELLTDIIFNSNAYIVIDPLRLVRFQSTRPFTIQDMSYNMRVLCGIYDFECRSVYDETIDRYVYRSPRYGSYNSTQIFFLVSSLGSNNFIYNKEYNLVSRNIFMKINNSIRSDIPVVYAGGDEKRTMNAIELSGIIDFTITDSNLIPLDLLDEMYITLRIRPLPYTSKPISSSILRAIDSGSKEGKDETEVQPVTEAE